MNILIADDDLTNRTVLTKFLEKWGYQVTVVTDGLQAWELLQSANAPRLALLDWMMPGMDGAELCRRLRQSGGTTYTYTILLSAKFQRQEILDGLAAGADDYITKPFHPAELAARLRTGCRIVELQQELLRAQQALQHQVSRDATTGLWSRAAILEFLEAEIQRGRREQSSFGVLLADVDHFKSINDSWGHLTGDEVLQQLGSRITSSLRKYDAAGRYGGEEFLVVVSAQSMDELAVVAERLRSCVADAPMETRAGPLPVTISLGYELWQPETNPDSQPVLLRADEALYRAKASGRNRAVAAAFAPAR